MLPLTSVEILSVVSGRHSGKIDIRFFSKEFIRRGSFFACMFDHSSERPLETPVCTLDGQRRQHTEKVQRRLFADP